VEILTLRSAACLAQTSKQWPGPGNIRIVLQVRDVLAGTEHGESRLLTTARLQRGLPANRPAQHGCKLDGTPIARVQQLARPSRTQEMLVRESQCPGKRQAAQDGILQQDSFIVEDDTPDTITVEHQNLCTVRRAHVVHSDRVPDAVWPSNRRLDLQRSATHTAGRGILRPFKTTSATPEGSDTLVCHRNSKAWLRAAMDNASGVD
jgi:hypothetical protein